MIDALKTLSHGGCRVRIFKVLLLGMLGVLPTLSFVAADSGAVQYLPKAGGPTKSGLRMLVDSLGVNGYGYRPVRVEVMTANGLPSTTTRELTITVQPNPHYCRHETRQVVTLPSGAASVTAIILVPQVEVWNWFNVETRENGNRIKELSSEISDDRSSSYELDGPNLLFIFGDAYSAQERAMPNSARTRQSIPCPSLAGVYSLLSDGYNYATGDQFSEVDQLEDIDELAVRPLEELSDQWLAYTSYSLVIITKDDLEKLQATRPNVVQALRLWASNGGGICVLGVDGKDSQKQLSKWLDLEVASTSSSSPSAENDEKAAWQQLQTSHTWVANPNHYQDDYYYYEQEEPSAIKPVPIQRQREVDGQLLTARIGAGAVLAVNQESPSLKDDLLVRRVFDFLDDGRWEEGATSRQLGFTSRHGMQPMARTFEFWNFRVPGVGRAPVLLFCVMITFFAVAIGPVNYFALAKLGRLQWMLITVPLGAGLMITLLFTYAIAADGFGHRSRTRSVTLLDQRSQISTMWSRQTYFSGIAPRNGLLFPDSAAVYPLKKVSQNDYRDVDTNQHILDWEEDGQRLGFGYIASRDPAQFLVVDSRAEDRRRVIFRKQGDSFVARNQLGVPLFGLFVKDENGDGWWFKNLPVDEEVTGEPFDGNSLPIAAKNFILEHSNLEDGKSDYRDNYGYRSYYRYMYGGNDIDFSQSILESQIRWINGYASRPRRSYIAITDNPEGVTMGLDNVQSNNCLHFFIGQY